MELPSVFERVKAAIIDGIIIILLIMLISDIFNAFEEVAVIFKIIGFTLVFLLYDPLLTSFTGGTIGHKFSGIRVKKQIDVTKNISFHLAVLRFICKALLGWISLLTITGNKNKQAIHDMIVKSMVVYKTE